MARGKQCGLAGLFLVWFLAFGPGGLAAFAASGPEQTVAMLQKGINTRSLALVETYLDLDAIVNRAVDAAMADDALLREAGKNPALAIALAMGGTSGGNDAFRTLLASEFREYVRHGVVSGAFAGKPVEGASVYRGIFGKAFRGGEKDKAIFGPATVREWGKKGAVVTGVLFQGARGRQFPLELRVVKQKNVWRVVELINTPELVRSGGTKEAK